MLSAQIVPRWQPASNMAPVTLVYWYSPLTLNRAGLGSQEDTAEMSVYDFGS